MKENENKVKINVEAKHFDILPKSESINLRAGARPEFDKTNPSFLEKRDAEKENDDFNSSFQKDGALQKDNKKIFNKSAGFLRKLKNSDETVSSENIKLTDNKIGKIFDKAIKWLLYLLVFSLPIFILPLSMEIYEFNKTLLLFVISSLAFLLWIIKMVLIDRRLAFARTPLDIPIIIFILIAIISTIYSIDKTSSVLGFYGRFSDSLTVYLSLAMFYFTAVNNIRNWKLETGNYREESNNTINNFLKTFLASAFVIAIVGLFYILGFKFIPWEEAQFRSFNLAGGSLNVLAIYLIPVIIISLSYLNKNSKIAARYALFFLVILSLFILAAADFILAWIILAVSLAVVLALGIISQKVLGASKKILEPGLIAVVLISLIFIASSLTFINKDTQTNFSSSAISDFLRDKLAGGEGNTAREGFTKEVVIEKGVAIAVAIDSSKSRPILGSGPGTYLYDFSKFKPSEFNNNAFWNIRFDKAGSEILEKISTIGIAGALSYLIIIVLAMGMFLRMLLKIPLTPHSAIAQGRLFYKGGNPYLFAAWFAFLLFQFLYLEATTTKFIFWLFTAILAGEYIISRRRHSRMSPTNDNNDNSDIFILNFKKNKTAFLISLAALLIIFASFAASYYYQARFYKAEMAYKNSVVKQSLDQSASDLENIIKLNPYRGEYEVYLSNVSLGKLAAILQEQNEGAASEEDMQKIGLEAKGAIDRIKRAVELGPNNVSFQQKFGSTYAILNRNLNIEKADEWAIKGYQRAIELEPTNPVLHTELGKIYVLQFYKLKEDDKADQAIKEFKKAIELKNDYADAILELGLAYEAKGDYEKAIEAINSLENIGNISVNAAFQMGRIYYNSGKANEAKSIFLEIIRIEPNNSNAHYSLGLIYSSEGDKEKALEEFEMVLLLNPGNEDVKNKIDEIKSIGNNKKNEEAIKTEIPYAIEEENIETETIFEEEN